MSAEQRPASRVVWENGRGKRALRPHPTSHLELRLRWWVGHSQSKYLVLALGVHQARLEHVQWLAQDGGTSALKESISPGACQHPSPTSLV